MPIGGEMKEIDARFHKLWQFTEHLDKKIDRNHDRIVMIERALGSMSKVMEDGDE